MLDKLTTRLKNKKGCQAANWNLWKIPGGQADETMLAKNRVHVYVATNSFKVRPPAISIEEKVERMGLCAVNFASLETGNGSFCWMASIFLVS